MNLINTDIKPDPFDPQTGDVYQYGAPPFVQRLVVEDAPTREDPRVRYRIDGGTDSNLTTVAQFHRHLAGLTDLHGVGRVREYQPITTEVRKSLVHQLRSTALEVDQVAGDLMRGAAATIVEQAAALDGIACREALEQTRGRLALLQEAVAQALAENIPDIEDASATAGLVERLGLLIAALPEVYREREEAEARATERASSLMVTRDALWSTLGAVSLGSLRVPTAATHLLDSLGSVYGDRTAISLAELIDAAFAFGICASRHPELPEFKCGEMQERLAERESDIKKLADVVTAGVEMVKEVLARIGTAKDAK